MPILILSPFIGDLFFSRLNGKKYKISRDYEIYFLNRIKELVLKYPGIVTNFKLVLKLCTIFNNMYRYLENLKEVNSFDKKKVFSYIKKIKE